jgi:DNA helicase II / ATP-dependent DNA helicase PcrA
MMNIFEGKAEEFVRTEVPMEALLDEVPIKGFADKIQYWGNDVEITDFKTGSLDKSNRRHEFAEQGHPKKPEGGNYWRQAVFYKILFDRQKGKTKELRSIQFHYIEPNDKKNFDIRKVIVTPEGEEFVKHQVKETWEKIRQHDFYKGCGKPECDWCNFVKDHKIYVQMHEVEEMDVL